MDVFELWELLKEEITKYCKQYSKEKVKQEKLEKFNLYRLLESLQREWMEDNADENCLHSMLHVESCLNAYAEMDVEKAAFRCRKQWIRNGEKNSNIFLVWKKEIIRIKLCI